MLLDHDTADGLRRSHPAWKLLAADHGALIVSFLHRTFILPLQRPLFAPPHVLKIEARRLDLGESENDAGALYERYLDASRAVRPAAAPDQPCICD